MEMVSDMESALRKYRTTQDMQLKELADKLGVSSPVLYKWETRQVPAERCALVEKVTGIPCHVLRPGVFPAPRKARTAA
jgi:DNA-binding transcriptional regulator YdaS (Cro superfamily)